MSKTTARAHRVQFLTRLLRIPRSANGVGRHWIHAPYAGTRRFTPSTIEYTRVCEEVTCHREARPYELLTFTAMCAHPDDGAPTMSTPFRLRSTNGCVAVARHVPWPPALDGAGGTRR